ncbi:hypothetical protein [uncultured Methanosphaera sp.]|uniref:hypothetical protein n=1 Tax=uncultured Methanosphaera sp. TaxID=262501 RepID=UPI0025DE8512|nr:hypothetical protein [uncultured Methanosphaera sp.]
MLVPGSIGLSLKRISGSILVSFDESFVLIDLLSKLLAFLESYILDLLLRLSLLVFCLFDTCDILLSFEVML